MWAESWGFELAADDGSLGGYARLCLYPNLDRAWFWASVAGPERRLVLVRDQDVPLPRRGTTDVRAEGLWSAFTCEAPNDHWSVGVEAFAVALDDPEEALGAERGDRVALGLDLEWQATSPPFPAGAAAVSGTRGYEQPCEVFGDILVGSERIAFAGAGFRDRRWGVWDWWSGPRWRVAGRLGGGRTFAAWGAGTGARDRGRGYVADGSRPSPAELVAIDTELTPAGLPTSASLLLSGVAVPIVPIAHAPLRVQGPGGRSSRLARALCRCGTAGGEIGAGWGEWLLAGEGVSGGSAAGGSP